MTKVKNWRRRAEEDEDDEAAAKPAQEVKESKSAIKRKEAQKKNQAVVVKPSGSKLLSFAGDEEEGDGDGDAGERTKVVKKERGKERVQLKQGGAGVFRFGEEGADGELVLLQSGGKEKKKSGYGLGQSGHKIEVGKEKAPTVSKLPSNVQAQAGEYTKEKLLELQRNTKTLGAPKTVVESNVSEPVVVLKGLVKPVVEEKVSVEGKIRARVEESESQVRSGKDDALARVEYDAEKRLGLMGIGSGADGGGITHIPDAAVIAAAKARRNQLRQAQAAPDYIPVNDGDVRGGVRGDGEGEKDAAESSEDEAEVHGRMSFIGENIGSKNKAVFEMSGKDMELGHNEDDDADEDRHWEEEQLRKGFGKRVEEVSHRVVPGAVGSVVHGGFNPGYAGMPSAAVGYGLGRGPMEVMTVQQQAEVAWQSLQENMKRLRVRCSSCPVHCGVVYLVFLKYRVDSTCPCLSSLCVVFLNMWEID